ncbi:Uncharacterised protein [Mycobacteroides abscessus]|nr:Uncharacterised protein [Mycobacteroides abscessus]
MPKSLNAYGRLTARLRSSRTLPAVPGTASASTRRTRQGATPSASSLKSSVTAPPGAPVRASVAPRRVPSRSTTRSTSPTVRTWCTRPGRAAPTTTGCGASYQRTGASTTQAGS